MKNHVCYSPYSDQNAEFQAPKVPQPFTLVFMWIDIGEISDKVCSNPCITLQHQTLKLHAYFHVSLQHEGDSAGEREQAPRPTAAETNETIQESFQAFKLKISQRKHKKAVLHEVFSFSQLESACLEPFDEGGADILRSLGGPDGKLECQDSFYLGLGIHYSRPEDKAAEMTYRESRSTSIGQYF